MQSQNTEITLLVQNLTKEDEFHNLDVEIDVQLKALSASWKSNQGSQSINKLFSSRVKN